MTAPSDTVVRATVLRLASFDEAGIISQSLAHTGGFDAVAQLLTADDPQTASAHLPHPIDKQAVEKLRSDFARTGGWDSGAIDVAAMAEHDARLIAFDSPEYPTRLKSSGTSAPVALWVTGSGHLAEAVEESVTVTGARASTQYGDHVAEELAHDLVRSGTAVISSTGFGIDTAAMRGALMATDSGDELPRALAVLPQGLDIIYPQGNASLHRQLTGRGMLVTEAAPGAQPTRAMFLRRARVLAALSQASVIVEAGQRSGALGVAARAHELGRAVGAVPGPTTSAASAGTHRLIKQGTAMLVTDADDVLAVIDR
ncbi:DNA-processing protein DprA [Nocardiopsis sp. JB363]|uniref:DNA-processing protein DprA n=1 Tax=Nocardiopsis sp. JB363 TaxID=1434837 RepID=UPI00097ABC75|nr:DNA-processing protein DprA [Nocardiopsis sp. JB363]SIO87004.1 Rossmann fold nucleotide-binding protein Smf possibly involved in DNA uptake [Nocardiopsis sp. JB363]